MSLNIASLVAASLLLFLVAAEASPAIDDGRYAPDLYDYGDDGRYVRPKDEGKYIHIPNPYDGGYGPYSGDWERYKHDKDGQYDESLNAEASYKHPVTVKPTTTTTPYPTIHYINNGKKIIRQDQALKEDGFKYLYETENKILAHEKAVLKNPTAADVGLATSGSYQYVGPDGVLYKVTYTADENGFIPKMTRVKYPESLDDGFTKLKNKN